MHTSACDFQIPEIGKGVKEASMPFIDNVTLINLHLMQLLLHKFGVRSVKIDSSRSIGPNLDQYFIYFKIQIFFKIQTI